MTARDYMALTIRKLRKARGMTAEELGKLVGRSKSAVESWEVGRTQPDADKLIDLCRVLEVDVSTFFSQSASDIKRSSKEDSEKPPHSNDPARIHGITDKGT